jgi:hypothetical protein
VIGALVDPTEAPTDGRTRVHDADGAKQHHTLSASGLASSNSGCADRIRQFQGGIERSGRRSSAPNPPRNEAPSAADWSFLANDAI